jgi:hypothetical protein
MDLSSITAILRLESRNQMRSFLFSESASAGANAADYLSANAPAIAAYAQPSL